MHGDRDNLNPYHRSGQELHGGEAPLAGYFGDVSGYVGLWPIKAGFNALLNGGHGVRRAVNLDVDNLCE